MAGTLISTFYNGDTTTNSLTAIQQTMLRTDRSYDGIVFGNYVKGNTDMLNVLAGSSITVNMNCFTWSAAESILLLNANGTTSSMDNAGAAEYFIVAVINADKTCTVYARLASSVTITGNPNYSGWYITNTQQRVLGGVTKSASGTYIRKWRYKPYNFSNGSPDERYNRDYLDGLVTDLSVNTKPTIIYESNTVTGYNTHSSVVNITTDFTLTHPCKLWLTANGYTVRISQQSSYSGVSALRCDLYYLDGDTELCLYKEMNLTFPYVSSGSYSATATTNDIIDMSTGTYRVKIYNPSFADGLVIMRYPVTNFLKLYKRDEICKTDTTY